MLYTDSVAVGPTLEGSSLGGKMTSLSRLSKQAAILLTVLLLAGLVEAEDAAPNKSELTKSNSTAVTLYQSSGMSDRVRQLSSGLIDQVESSLIQNGIANRMNEGKMTQPEAEKFVVERVKPVMDKLRKDYPPGEVIKDLDTAIVSGLEKNLTAEEIDTLAKYYNSPAHQRYLHFNDEGEKTTASMLANQLDAYLNALREEADGGKPAGSFKLAGEPPDTKNVSPAKRELIKKMFATSGMGDVMTDLLVKAEEVREQRLRSDPNMAPAEKEKKVAQHRKYVDLIKTRLNLMEVIEPYSIANADKALSEDDLKFLIDFNENPAKQSMNKKFTKTMVEIIQSATTTVAGKVLTSVYGVTPPKNAADDPHTN